MPTRTLLTAAAAAGLSLRHGPKNDVTWTIKAFIDDGQALGQRHVLLLLVQVLLPVPWCCYFLVGLFLWGGFVRTGALFGYR